MRTLPAILATGTFLIAAMSSTASAHCPEGGECVTAEEAKKRIEAECKENKKRREMCESQLVKCEKTDVELQKMAGKLETCKADKKDLQRRSRHLDRKVARSWQTGDVLKVTVGGFVIGAGLGGLAYSFLSE